MRGEAKRKTRSARLRYLNKVKGVTFDDMAKALGGKTNPNYLVMIANEVLQKGRKTPRSLSDDYATRLEKAYNLDENWFDKPEHNERMSGIQYEEPVSIRQKVSDKNTHYFPVSNRKVVTIDMLNVNGSMGRGGPVDYSNDEVIGGIDTTKQWINSRLSHATAIKNIKIITGLGDSMEPTFSNGDALFVDTGIKETNVDAIYVIDHKNKLFIKRIQRLPGGRLNVISDNRKYDPYIIDNKDKDEFHIIGRAIGALNFNKL